MATPGSSKAARIAVFTVALVAIVAWTFATYRYYGEIIFLPIIGYLGTKVGYRAIDFLFLFVPLYSWAYIVKIVWRSSALPFNALQPERQSWSPVVVQQVLPMAAPPGWYNDPSGQQSFRFYDGYQWTQYAVTGPVPTEFPVQVQQYVQPIEQRGTNGDENSVTCPTCGKVQFFKHKHAVA